MSRVGKFPLPCTDMGSLSTWSRRSTCSKLNTWKRPDGDDESTIVAIMISSDFSCKKVNKLKENWRLGKVYSVSKDPVRCQLHTVAPDLVMVKFCNVHGLQI